MRGVNRKSALLSCSLFLAGHTALSGSTSAVAPTNLENLEYSNPRLIRLRREIGINLQATASSGRLGIPLRLMKYRIKKGRHFFDVMARTSQNAATLASLNGIINPGAATAGDTILIPNARGLYVAGDRQKISRRYRVAPERLVRLGEGWFIPGHRFDNRRLNYFLGRGFLPPLRKARLTSGYGMRQDPFTSRATFHGGIDLAAPFGTPVHASREGVVRFTGWASGYGRLVVIKHRYGYETYYGHLSRILVRKGERVKVGRKIALVGSSGRSTGNHLHFEVRRRGHRRRPRLVGRFR